jgi:NADPH-dependent 2,4-dienoyl-CoA reductase/sulfur reductase-like enzyme
MGHMRYQDTKPYEDWFWAKNRIELKKAWVERVDCETKTLFFSDKTAMNYDELVLTTGSRYKKPELPGSTLKGVQGLYHLSDLALLEENTKNVKQAVVTGGGLIGIELIEMLASRKIEVFFIVREFKFWSNVLPPEESVMVQKHMRNHHIHILLDTELKEIKSDQEGRVSSVITNHGQEINCQFVGITIGVEPNIDFLKDSGISLGKGIKVNTFLETNIKDIYAAGDCAEFDPPIKGRPAVEQIWYTGRMHGECLGKTLAGKKTEYLPVNFFNSAKLLDIEFQMYTEDVHIPKGTEHFFWQSDDSLKSMRFYFDLNTKRFLGVVLLGIRYRHEICDRWLRENRNIEYVLQHLEDANFDPEFYRHYENEVLFIYNKPQKRNWKRILGIK